MLTYLSQTEAKHVPMFGPLVFPPLILFIGISYKIFNQSPVLK